MIEYSVFHYLAILVAAVVKMFLGSVWYNPNFLGKKWAEVHKFEESTLHAGALQYLGAFLNSLVMAWALGSILIFFEVTTISSALCLGFWIWLGFIATTQFSGVLWAKKPFTAYLIDAGFFLVGILAMSVVFGIFF